ncbi:MAG TPA: zinc ribbon domain-containing protein [Candidatus Paceibacterota bacterium]|nr:zinc ribbon domain-containing protein [Candidatus Paceibacterota bacterium]
MDLKCPSCGNAISPDFYFCPNCGKKLKEPPPSTSFSAQFTVYFVSLFIPPFGLWYAYKYLRYKNETPVPNRFTSRKKIGWAAVILTVLGIWLVVWTSQVLINSLNQALTGITGL